MSFRMTVHSQTTFLIKILDHIPRKCLQKGTLFKINKKNKHFLVLIIVFLYIYSRY